jgi:hypothetical protein
MSDQEPRRDATLKNLTQDAQDLLWELMRPNGDKPGMSVEQMQAEIALRHGFTVAPSTIYEWRKWYAMRRRFEAAKERAAQAKLEFLKENPDASADELRRVGDFVFTSEAIEGNNIKAYVSLAKLELNRRQFELDSRRLALLEAKATAADQAKEVLEDSGITQDEKNRRLREILK